MIYKNTAELKSKIVQIMNSTDKNSKYYNDLKWFSNINYTTTTEYFGELKLFLSDIVNLDEFKHYKSDLLDIINQISQLLNWIYVFIWRINILKTEIEIIPYNSEKGIEFNWEYGFEINTSFDKEILISANKAGLISLARHLLTLAQDSVPSGTHIHFDDLNSLEDGSIGLIIEKL